MQGACHVQAVISHTQEVFSTRDYVFLTAHHRHRVETRSLLNQSHDETGALELPIAAVKSAVLAVR